MQSSKVVKHDIPEPEGYDEELEKRIGTARYHIWTDEQVATLRRYYGVVDTKELAKALGVDWKNVKNKARDLDLSFKKQQQRFFGPANEQ